jgi:hypothetical protein
VQGYYYVVDVAGTTNLNGITDWQVGDWAIFNGSIWQKVDNTDSYDPANVAITGGTINNTVIGGTTPATGVFTTLTATGQTSLGGVAGSDVFRVLRDNTFAGTTVASFTAPQFSFIPPQSSFGAAVIGLGLNPRINSFGSDGQYFSTNQSAGFSGTLQVKIAHTASAVNYVQATGAASGSGPTTSAQGSDTNINLNFTTKGTGSHVFNTGSGKQLQIADSAVSGGQYTLISRDNTNNVQLIGTAGNAANLGLYAYAGGSVRIYTNPGLIDQQLVIPPTTSAVNYIQIKGGATGTAPLIQSLGSDTNIPLVVQPKGTGALQAQQTDSTATGGNARGANAVDLQTSRGVAGQVASGSFTVISGGFGNSNGGFASVVSGGYDNGASGNFSSILGGRNTTASGTQAVAVGGYLNTAAGYLNFIGGGFTNSGTSGSVVTTQSATMNATTAVTLSGSNASIKVGQYITGTSISGDTYVAAISGTSLTLSKVASGSSTSTLSFFTPHGVVVGGGNNQATGSYSFIGGGGDAGTAANRNVASGDWSTVGGGFVTKATGKWSTAGGGIGNTASGEGSVVVGGGSYGGGGSGNTASSTSSFVGAGYGNTANGYCSTVVGGTGNVASNNFSFVGGGGGNSANTAGTAILGGYSGTTRSIEGMQAIPACTQPINSIQGTTQAALLVLGVQTTDATATILRSNTSAASGTNQIILPNNSAYYFKGSVIANVTGAANGASWSFEGAIMRGANAASTVLIGTPAINRVASTSGASAWTIALTADTTNGGLAVTVTGAAATTIRWVCKAETTEVTF